MKKKLTKKELAKLMRQVKKNSKKTEEELFILLGKEVLKQKKAKAKSRGTRA